MESKSVLFQAAGNIAAKENICTDRIARAFDCICSAVGIEGNRIYAGDAEHADDDDAFSAGG